MAKHYSTMEIAMSVSIIIKAYNEEMNIERAIQSALECLKTTKGEVILADSLSTDKTVELACKFPIKIVQLENSNERCCGIGPELGFQHVTTEFVYIMDGDMMMLPGFLDAGLQYLRNNPSFAGVGGKVIEMNTSSLEFIARVERGASHMKEGIVDRLDMGGLYRTEAIKQSGYFSNKNLHSYEEVDLALRLRVLNWQLARIDVEAVKHWGHDVAPYFLLKKRWSSRYIFGLGELIRASLFTPRFFMILKDIKELRIYAMTILWWFLLSTFLLSESSSVLLLLFFMVLFSPLIAIIIKKRSTSKGIYSFVSWNVNAIALCVGFLRPQKSPFTKFAYRRIQ